MRMTIYPLFGTLLEKKTTQIICNAPSRRMTFCSKSGDIMDLSSDLLSKHFLMIGGIGTGKTNTFLFLIEGLNASMNEQDVMLIFDTKGDFYHEFYMEGFDCVIGNSAEFAEVTSYWNVFREIEFGGRNRQEKELMAKEIAKNFFEDRKNASQPFFSTAACDLFGKVLLDKMREFWGMDTYKAWEEKLRKTRRGSQQEAFYIEEQHRLFEQYANRYNNRVLVREIFQKYTAQDYIKMLEKHADFRGALSYLGDGKNNQALGVLGEMNSMVNDYFVGIFGDYEKGRDISMRELVHEKGGKKVFIEYDLSVGETLCSVYRLLMDLGLKEALGRTRSEGQVYLMIDEFRLLPKLSHIDDALNFGRSLGIRAAVGIQNIKQLEDVYGETRGQVIAAGFSNVIAFRMTDEASRKYISELFGKNYLSVHYADASGQDKCAEREGYTVEDWQLIELQVGEAIVGLFGKTPFYFSFQEYDRR